MELQIEWRNAKHPAERTREVLAGPEVREMITDRFTTASWMSPAIQHLQKVQFTLAASTLLIPNRCMPLGTKKP